MSAKGQIILRFYDSFILFEKGCWFTFFQSKEQTLLLVLSKFCCIYGYNPGVRKLASKGEMSKIFYQMMVC